VLRGGKIPDEQALEGLRLVLSSADELQEDDSITEKIILTPMSLTVSNFEESPFKQVGESWVGVQDDDEEGGGAMVNAGNDDDVAIIPPSLSFPFLWQTMFSSTEERVWDTLQDACRWQLKEMQLSPEEEQVLSKAASNR